MSCNKWIAEVVKGKTFADVGGLWGTVNERVTVAAKAGAAKTAMIDMQPLNNDLWKKFYDRCVTENVGCDKNIEANIDDPEFPKIVGDYDVVHCSGVIYHCPNPLYTVSQLSKITNDILILGSTAIPANINNDKGKLIVETGGGLFVPALNSYQREVAAEYFKEVGALNIVGIDPSLQNSWSLEDYSPWWWLYTRECIAGLLRVCGFKVEDTCDDWGGKSAYFLAVRE